MPVNIGVNVLMTLVFVAFIYLMIDIVAAATARHRGYALTVQVM